MSRVEPLHIYGPVGIEEMILHILSFSSAGLNYDLIFHEISNFNGTLVFENDRIKVKSLPLDHKIPTSGYLFEEKQKKKKLNLQRIHELMIPIQEWKHIESGKDILSKDNVLINNEDLTIQNHEKRKYAYCSDTRYQEALIPYLTGVNVLYHETTYLDELKIKAMENGHSTALQAATLANKCHAKMLLTGHYSSRYEHLEEFEKECKSIFENVVIGEEGLLVKVV